MLGEGRAGRVFAGRKRSETDGQAYAVKEILKTHQTQMERRREVSCVLRDAPRKLRSDQHHLSIGPSARPPSRSQAARRPVGHGPAPPPPTRHAPSTDRR